MSLILAPRFQHRPRVSPSSLPRVAPILPEPPPPSPVSADVANVAPFVDAPLSTFDPPAPRGKIFAHVVEHVGPPPVETTPAPAMAPHRSRRPRALDLLAGGAGYAKARAKTIAGAVVAVALLFAVHAYDRSSTFEPTATVEPIGLATAVVEPAPIMTQEQPAAPTTAGELPHFAALEPADAIPLPPRRPTMIKVSPAHPLKRAVQARK